jgi:hypothetical protein
VSAVKDSYGLLINSGSFTTAKGFFCKLLFFFICFITSTAIVLKVGLN